MTLLGDLESAQVSLEPTMQAVKTGADECAAAAHEIDLKFGDWLEATSELHQSTLQESCKILFFSRVQVVPIDGRHSSDFSHRFGTSPCK